VAGVVPALIPGDDREVRRQQIDDLPLAFVAPLGPKYRDIGFSAHVASRSILHSTFAIRSAFSIRHPALI
jgi:hypothetical protein